MKAKQQPKIEALRLLGKWRQLSAGHVLLAAGCSCGVAASSMPMQSYEQDILGFLRGRHPRAAPAAGLAELLAGIARQGGKADLGLLADLERSLDSFETLHRGKRAS
jgi:hypothetical protein